MTTFSGLNTALTALHAQRRGLDVTGQNIANANTEGYSRQRAELTAVAGVRLPAMYSTGDPGPGGVTVTSVSRLHDEFFDNRARVERGLSAYLNGQRDIYGRVEQVIGEPSDTGLQSQLADLWSGWHDIANRPGDAAARTQLLSRARTIADTFANKHDGLASLWDSTQQQLGAAVTEVNQTAGAIAELNHRIIVAQQADLPANELADKRDQLVLKLSQLTGATSRPRDDGSVDVLISGSLLISREDVRQLELVGATNLTDQASDPVTVRWTDTKLSSGISSGSMASEMETLTTTIPTTAADLDALAAQLATAVNGQHQLGYDLNGTGGAPFFTGNTAKTLTVAISNTSEIAASDAQPTVNPDGSLSPNFNGANATALANLAKDPIGTDASYRTFVVNIGVAAQTVNRRAEVQDTIAQGVESARLATSGVSLDEEMTNMLQYQRAYEAAARVISVIDSTLDTLVNGMLVR